MGIIGVVGSTGCVLLWHGLRMMCLQNDGGSGTVHGGEAVGNAVFIVHADCGTGLLNGLALALMLCIPKLHV